MTPSTAGNIIIISNNQSIRNIIQNALTRGNPQATVHSCRNHKDALWIATDVKPAYVIIDYNEISTSPFDLIRKLKQLCENVQPIIVFHPESEEYRMEIVNKLATSGLNNIRLLTYDDIPVRLVSLF
jgi:PleD family two-component response regulator